MSYAVDRLLAGKPELQERFRRMAGDPGVSGDMLHRALVEAGIPAGRWAVFNWRRQYRLIPTARPDSLFARIVAAVRQLPDDRLRQLADRLRVPVDAPPPKPGRPTRLNQRRGGRLLIAAEARTLLDRVIVRLDRVGRSTLYRIGRELGVAALPDNAQKMRYRGPQQVKDAGFSTDAAGEGADA